jgi:hypothetical protein
VPIIVIIIIIIIFLFLRETQLGGLAARSMCARWFSKGLGSSCLEELEETMEGGVEEEEEKGEETEEKIVVVRKKHQLEEVETVTSIPPLW